MKKFIEYLNVPLDSGFLECIYNEYGITEMKCADYLTYINTLFDTVFNTYLGDEHINTQKLKYEHYRWCWDKTKKTNEPPFITNDEIMIWLGEFLNETWYSQEDKDFMMDKVKQFWSNTFDINQEKTRADLDFLVGFFVLTDKNKVIIEK